MMIMRPDPQRTQKFAPPKWMAAAVLVLLAHAGVAQALGLGNMKVLSQVGQPFAAEIDLINASRDDLAALKVNLAPPAAYEAANLRFDPALNALRLSVQRRANGTPYIRVNSLRRVSEPYLDVLVEVTGQDVKLKRAYSALLDLPESPQPAAATTAESVAAPGAPIAVAPAARPEALAPRAPAPSRAVQPRATSSTRAAAPATVVPVPATPAARAPEMPKEPARTAMAQAAPAAAETARAEPPAPTLAAPPGAPAEPAATQTMPATEPAKPAPETPDVGVAAKPGPAVPQASIAPPPGGSADSISNLPVWVGGALLALLALIGSLWVWRRRNEAPASVIEPTVTLPPAAAPVVTAGTTNAMPVHPQTIAAPATDRFDATATDPTVASVTDVVDPLDEARVHLEYGQLDHAETILREALSRQPGREDILLQLLEVLAQRGDKEGFNQLAGRVHKQTGGLGDAWKRVMTMGYTLDPGHALYSPTADAAPRSVPVTLPLAEPSGADDLQLEDRGNSIDMEKTLVLVRPGATPAAVPAATEPLSLPDINFELPPASAPARPAAVEATPVATAAQDHPGLDFKVDLPGIVDVKLDDATSPAADGIATESAREEVEKKLLLARAYREMGDKEGALELLREVEHEGDAKQLDEMRELMQSLT